MSPARPTRIVFSFALGSVLLAALAAHASGTYVPPLPQLQNKAFLAGEKLWRAKELLGPGGATCQSCHDAPSGPALDPGALLRKRKDLQKLVYFEIVTRAHNNVVRPDGPEVQALVQYLTERHGLNRLEHVPDDPRALEIIAEARNLYVAGDYSGAILALNQTLELTLSAQTAAESHMLLGSIFDVLGDQKRAREEFARVFQLFPTAQIDRETFSPKTVAFFETVRSETVTR
jgi:tetratricopeptide (TPR) repeat protein